MDNTFHGIARRSAMDRGAKMADGTDLGQTINDSKGEKHGEGTSTGKNSTQHIQRERDGIVREATE